MQQCIKEFPQNDIGIRTDVIENVSKYNGMQILIRSMGPEVIACDEIGTKEEYKLFNMPYVQV